MIRHALEETPYKKLITAVAAVTLLATAVMGQESAVPSDPSAPTALKPTVVTGSYIPTAETVGPAPVDTVNAESIERLGSADVLQSLKKVTPALSGNLNVGQEVNNGGFGESYIGIRNLQTLVLLNGRRLGNSSFSSGALVDLNTLPLSAVERIEVLKDGASALYGSEAIGGVVNIITKENYEGAEIGGRWGIATQEGSYQEYGASAVAGTVTDKANFMAAAQFYHQDALKTTHRDIAGKDSLELARLGITPRSYMSPSFNGRVGNYILSPQYSTPPVDPGVSYATMTDYLAAHPGVYTHVSETAPGRALDAIMIYPGTEFEYPLGAYYGYPLLNTTTFGTHSIQSQDRQNFYADGTHDLFDKRVQLHGSFLYANIESEGALAPSPVVGLAPKQANISIPADNPFNPFQIGLGPGFTNGLPPAAPRIRSRFTESGNRLFDAQTDYYHFVGGLNGEFEQGYRYDASYVYNRYDQVQSTRNAVNGAALDLALRPNTNPAQAARGLSQLQASDGSFVPIYNIFGIGRNGLLNDPSTLEAIGTTLFQTGVSEDWGANAVVSGEPLELPGGKLGFAVGGGFHSAALAIDYDGLTRMGKVPGLNPADPTSGRRDSWAAFAEVRVPITSPDMEIPALRSLELTAAGRYETFDPGGDSLVPKLGIRWQPIDEQVTLRASYSQSFVAPTTFQLFGGRGVSNPALVTADVYAQETVVYLSNPELEPVDAENWSVGFVLSPKFVPNLTLSVDYYHVQTENDIFRVGEQAMVNDLNARGAGSEWVNYYQLADGTRLTTTAPNQLIDATWGVLEVPLRNGAEIETDGLDITAAYLFDTETVGDFNFFANANVLFSYKYQDPISGGPFKYDGQYTEAANGIAGAQGTMPDFVLNLGVTWDYPIGDDGLSYTINAQYIPSVDDLGSLHPSNIEFERDVDDLMNDHTINGLPWEVDDWYRLDMQLAYEFGKYRTEDRRWWHGTRVAVGCNNITDNDPPLIASAFEDNTDKSTYDILGRFVYFELSKRF